jgi:hypothetical protein
LLNQIKRCDEIISQNENPLTETEVTKRVFIYKTRFYSIQKEYIYSRNPSLGKGAYSSRNYKLKYFGKLKSSFKRAPDGY